MRYVRRKFSSPGTRPYLQPWIAEDSVPENSPGLHILPLRQFCTRSRFEGTMASRSAMERQQRRFDMYTNSRNLL